MRKLQSRENETRWVHERERERETERKRGREGERERGDYLRNEIIVASTKLGKNRPGV